MLSRPRKAHNPAYECVVAAVRSLTPLSKQLVKAMRGPLPPTLRHIEAERPQTRCRHRDYKSRLALTALREVDQPLGYELVAREISEDSRHRLILGDQSERIESLHLHT